MPYPAHRESCSTPAVIQFEMSLNILVHHNGSHGSYLQTWLFFPTLHTRQPTHWSPKEGEESNGKKEMAEKRAVIRAVWIMAWLQDWNKSLVDCIVCRHTGSVSAHHCPATFSKSIHWTNEMGILSSLLRYRHLDTDIFHGVLASEKTCGANLRLKVIFLFSVREEGVNRPSWARKQSRWHHNIWYDFFSKVVFTLHIILRACCF